jgi:tripartite motif-containing protein 2/3/tripartite motif-containing protein 71
MFQNLQCGKNSKVHVATEGKAAIACVDAGDERYSFTEASVTCQLMSELTGDVTKCLVQYIVMTNQFQIKYQATSQGRHQLHIKVEGEHIKGSPFTVTVIRKIGTPIKIIDEMGAPQGIAFSQQNEKIVAEYGEHRITIISPSLDIDERFGSGGKENGQFNHPCGIAVDDDGNILVADQKNGRIQKFNSRGEYITKVNGNHNTHSLELGQPVGIGIHPHTKMIYVTDIKYHRVQILDPDLNYSSSFGSKGEGNGLFDQPKDVAFDSAGNVYVADNENHRIQVFSKTGQYLRKFGGNGNHKGDLLYYPSSISIDSEDVVYVTELYNYRVSMFTLQGDFLHSFGSKGKGKGEFSDPRGIKVDKNGTIYVSDHVNDRIQVF